MSYCSNEDGWVLSGAPAAKLYEIDNFDRDSRLGNLTPDQFGVSSNSPLVRQKQPKGWFVHFSSYGDRDKAYDWVQRLDPPSGSAVVQAHSTNGRTLYRVRVVGFSSKSEAESIATELERRFSLPRLWVGFE